MIGSCGGQHLGFGTNTNVLWSLFADILSGNEAFDCIGHGIALSNKGGRSIYIKYAYF